MEQNINLLPESDREYLKDKGYNYDICHNGAENHFILKDALISAKYKPNQVDILIKIPAGYPDAPLDMFWIFPEVKFLDGTAPAQTQIAEIIYGKNWQRWSRHPNWRLGVDSLRSFLVTIMNELQSQ